MTPLAIPLVRAQVEAANRLHAHLKQWVATDSALIALGKRFPDFGPESTLLKVAAVNQLYGTNLYAIVRMAGHAVHILAHQSTTDAGPALVEELATLPKKPNEKTQWHYYSFASKFAHFFIDFERFPIYDSYAVQTLERHLGPKDKHVDLAHPYLAYVDNLDRLAERSGLTWVGRELDRYLWLAGQYRAWRKNPRAQINTELAQLFERPPDEAAQIELATLLPD